MLAKGSVRFIIPPIILGLILLNFYFWFGVGFMLLGLYFAWFFRDPHRTILFDEEVLYAVADGKVKEIQDEDDELKIAIRMSPFDVHLNRAPIAGTVKKIVYKPGAHSNVYFGGVEEKNEQNLISMKAKDLDIDILQITGSFARRIECWVSIDDQVDQGEKIGIIRFGSQTNMVVKHDQPDDITIIPIVSIGQQVYAGSTPMARIRRNTDE